MFEILKADFAANPNNLKGRLILVLFRAAHSARCHSKWMMFLCLPYLIFYRVFVEWILGVEIPPLTAIGPGLALNHGQGLVVNNRTRIGANCRLRQGVTLGNRSQEEPDCPVLGDNVEIGANAVIIGGVTIGRDSIVAAGSVVTKDVPQGVIVAGVPARIIRNNEGR